MVKARLQVDAESLPDDKPPQTGTVFNIWYLKWSGGDPTETAKARFRVNIEQDSGETKASPKSPICLFFARGCCYLGSNCRYLHRLPQETDFSPPLYDCFGREKASSYNDDMSGVGSFNKINCTLYVGNIRAGEDAESVVSSHFLEFGSLERVRVLRNRGSAFVTYKLESEAQFAKEAMQNQSLNNEEVLVIRWASEDPNIEAQRAQQKRLEEIALQTVKDLLKPEKRLSDEAVEGSKKRKIESETRIDSAPLTDDESANVMEQTSDIPKDQTTFFPASTLLELKLYKLKSQPLVTWSSDEE